MEQRGFFDLSDHLKRLSETGDLSIGAGHRRLPLCDVRLREETRGGASPAGGDARDAAEHAPRLKRNGMLGLRQFAEDAAT